MSFQDYNNSSEMFADIYSNSYSQDQSKLALRTSPQILHPLPNLSRQSSGLSDDSNNRPLVLDHQMSTPVYSQQYSPHDSPQGWSPYDQQLSPHSFSPNPMTLSYDSFPTPSPFPAPRLSPAPLPHVSAMQSVNARLSLAGSLDPKTGIFYRTPEHPRLRTAQACEKCRTRKAKCSGEHPSCKRCISRGLICEYAKEGRVRGPNKPKLLKTGSTDSSLHNTSRGRTSSATSSAGSQEHRDIPQQVIKALREQSLQVKSQRISLPTETSLRRHSVGEQRSNLHLDTSSNQYKIDGPRSGGPEPRSRQFHGMVQRPPLQPQRTVEILQPSLTRAPPNSAMGTITPYQPPYQPPLHLSGTSHVVGMPGPEGMHYGNMVRAPGIATSQGAYMHQQRCREVGLMLDDGFNHEDEFRHGPKPFPSPQSVASMGSPMIQNQVLHYSRNGEPLENHSGSMPLDASWVDLRASFNGNHHVENTYINGHGHRIGPSNGPYSADSHKQKQNMGSGDPHAGAMHYPMDLQIC